MTKKYISIFLFIVLFVLNCGVSNPKKPELFINLTSDVTSDPHSGLMGLHLAQKAISNQITVTIFLNVHSVKLMGQGGDQISFHDEKNQRKSNSFHLLIFNFFSPFLVKQV